MGLHARGGAIVEPARRRRAAPISDTLTTAPSITQGSSLHASKISIVIPVPIAIQTVASHVPVFSRTFRGTPALPDDAPAPGRGAGTQLSGGRSLARLRAATIVTPRLLLYSGQLGGGPQTPGRRAGSSITATRFPELSTGVDIARAFGRVDALHRVLRRTEQLPLPAAPRPPRSRTARGHGPPRASAVQASSCRAGDRGPGRSLLPFGPPERSQPPDPRRVEWQSGAAFPIPRRLARASTSAPQSGHPAGSGSRTSMANCVWQPRHSPATVSRRSGDARRQMRPPAAGARSTLLHRQAHDAVRPRRRRLEPSEDVAGVQRPAVSIGAMTLHLNFW